MAAKEKTLSCRHVKVNTPRLRRTVSRLLDDLEAVLQSMPSHEDMRDMSLEEKEKLISALTKHSALLLKLIPLQQNLMEASVPRSKKSASSYRLTKKDVAIMKRYVERSS